jgi:hypothetical protein
MKLSGKAQTALDRVVERFKSGDLSPLVAVAMLRRDPPLPWDTWSYANRVCTYVQSSGSSDLRGWAQWKEAGRYVRKGSKAAYLIIPRTRTDENKETGEKEQHLVGWSTAPVFPVESTEGDDLPEYNHTPVELPPLVDVAQQLGISIEYKPVAPDREGDLWASKRINLGTTDQTIFFHELAHAIDARVNGRQKTKEEKEVVAEFTACVLAEFYAIGDRTGNAWSYMKLFHNDPLTAIQKSIAHVEKILAFLLPEEESA